MEKGHPTAAGRLKQVNPRHILLSNSDENSSEIIEMGRSLAITHQLLKFDCPDVGAARPYPSQNIIYSSLHRTPVVVREVEVMGLQ